MHGEQKNIFVSVKRMLEVNYMRLNVEDKINILLNDMAMNKPIKEIHVRALIEAYGSLKKGVDLDEV